MDFIINAAVTFVTVAFTLVAVLAIVRWRDRRAHAAKRRRAYWTAVELDMEMRGQK